MGENGNNMVLVVDDTPKNLQVVGAMLVKEGYRVSVAKNGKVALDVVKKVMPDLILLDIMMPELDGFETCKQLKSAPETKDIPIIFLTAKVETEDIVKAFTMGGVDYVVKPFKTQELLARVKTHLALKNANDVIRQRENDLRKVNAEIEQQKNIAIQQKNKIESQNKSITDSILYGQKIQSAIFPPLSYINTLLPNNFVFFKPKDIVSGDFYWLEKADDCVVLAVADCTGHGVPGAFMSMLGISFLNEIVLKRKITAPDIILNELRKLVKQSLRQETDAFSAKDGMDMGVCLIDTNSNRLTFSGAFNPLYLIRSSDDTSKIIELKADRMPIGIHLGQEKPFSKHEVEIQKDDVIYLCSDGYIDQIGGEKEKKFMRKRFKELLLNICDKPMIEQKEILETTLAKWMGKAFQIDDILVVAVRV